MGPGTVFGGRYALLRLRSQGRDLEQWSAQDGTLEREVTLTIIDAKHPSCAGVLDAARRAAGVEDTRLVRILDVGTHEGSSFIVEEAMSGSESLATVLLQGPLPAEEARRVAGESAKGLETAGVRGLHHLRLTPHHILIAPDGTIRVSGVAVAAALDGSEAHEPDAVKALRRDAVSLVAVVYAALTSRWPLDEHIDGLEPAPRLPAGVVLPSEIAAGVPADLDALCRLTLNEGAGPLTPGVVANRIAPWSRERVLRAEVDPTVVLQAPGSHDVPSAVTVAAPAFARRAVPTASTGTRVIPTAPDGRAEPVPSTAFAEAEGGKDAHLRSSNNHGQMKLPVGLRPADDFGPPLAILPASTALPPTRGQTQLVILVVVAFLGLALFFGYRGLVGLGAGSDLGISIPKRTASAPAVTVPASRAPQTAAAGAGPIAILSATGFDPEGDQQESNPLAARVYDGNPSTAWTSELYRTAQFGNLKKGVGLLLDLGQPKSIHQVTVDVAGGPVDFSVYAATSRSLQGAATIGSVSAASGQVQVKDSSPLPESQFVIVWFTSLAPVGGQFGAQVSEIALS